MASVNTFGQIVCFGDSLTQRGWEPQNNGWVASLASAYTRKLEVRNRGFSGYNSKWCVKLLPKLKEASKVELLIIFIGVNDSVLPVNELQHVTLEEYRANLHALIRIGKDLSKRVLLISPTPCNVEAWTEHRKKQGRANDRR